MPAPFRISGRDHHPIQDLDGWAALVAPVRPEHWKPLYSAFEFARLGLGDEGLAAVRSVLELVPATSGFTPEQGIAEAQTRFDEHGAPRNHDLLLIGTAGGGRTVVGIESKVNEPFGQTLAEYDKAASRAAGRGESTNASERLDTLTQTLGGWVLPDPDEDDTGLRSLRFELFSALAGTIAAAGDEGATQAVFCAYEVVTPLSDPGARATNASDLRNFARVIAPAAGTQTAGEAWIAGPGKVVRRTLRLPSSVTFYIAKVTSPML
jgi:Domain of unknown function (DUF6946)